MDEPHDVLARALMHAASRETGKDFPWHQEDRVRQAAHEFVQSNVVTWQLDLVLESGQHWSLIGTEAGLVVMARATEEDVEFRYLGTLAGAEYVERWEQDHTLRATVSHERLPEPITIEGRPSRVKSYAAAREFFQNATRPA